jgi:hypothetical protein
MKAPEINSKKDWNEEMKKTILLTKKDYNDLNGEGLYVNKKFFQKPDQEDID